MPYNKQNIIQFEIKKDIQSFKQKDFKNLEKKFKEMIIINNINYFYEK
tara:strand:- start:160 stop:303 length:144 start_codon:yes stop_codon:yes gene_type:complete